jgi:hypothetical protein
VPDFADGDFVLVRINAEDLSSPEDPFPDGVPFSSFQRLAWIIRNRARLEGVVCDMKTGALHLQWLDAVAPRLFFVRLLDWPDRTFVVPRGDVRPLANAQAVRKTVEEHMVAFPSHQNLAAYAQAEEGYPRLLERLVVGKAAGHAPVLPFTELWELSFAEPLGPFLDDMFRHREQATSFRRSWDLYEWLNEHETCVELHHVETQPLAGDFVLEHRGSWLTVQYKVAEDAHGDWFSPTGFFDILLMHRPHSNELAAYLRDRSWCSTFQYDKDGARSFVDFLKSIASSAPEAHIEVMKSLRQELLHRPALKMACQDDAEPDDANHGEEEGNDPTGAAGHASFRRRAYYVAMVFYRYLNADPDDLGLGLACIYLNWDQSHIYGDAIVVQHQWTAAERKAFRTFELLPVCLQSLRVQKPRRCLVLRFCNREYSNRSLTGFHLPLRQTFGELPLTDQKFFLLCAPDRTCESRVRNQTRTCGHDANRRAVRGPLPLNVSASAPVADTENC